MHSSKIIDISKSSLVALKAELLKKQEEVQKLKHQQDCLKPVIKQKKNDVKLKSNKGVESRNLKDIEDVQEDFDELLKSRQVLEAKSKLYDKLKNSSEDGEAKSQYLIDFDLKNEIYPQEESSSNKSEPNKDDDHKQTSEDEEKYDSDENSDPENDWVDFVDTLGRSRRCLRRDLPEMKAKDKKLANTLRPPSPPPKPEPTPELLSWDMQREAMRKKWEEQETLLLGKKDIHYQDVRFDEARPHGVAYFEFSTDENKRLQQQQELLNLRKQTMEQQEAAAGLRLRRQQQMKARLDAARRRKRERLGLPPEEEQPEATEADQKKTEVAVEEKQENVEDLVETIKKIAPVRAWDIGKETLPLMSQEEWIEKKREERPEEFAPPTSTLINTFKAPYPQQKEPGIISDDWSGLMPRGWEMTTANPNYSTTKRSQPSSKGGANDRNQTYSGTVVPNSSADKGGQSNDNRESEDIGPLPERFGHTVIPNVSNMKADHCMQHGTENDWIGPVPVERKGNLNCTNSKTGPATMELNQIDDNTDDWIGPMPEDWKRATGNCAPTKMGPPDSKVISTITGPPALELNQSGDWIGPVPEGWNKTKNSKMTPDKDCKNVPQTVKVDHQSQHEQVCINNPHKQDLPSKSYSFQNVNISNNPTTIMPQNISDKKTTPTDDKINQIKYTSESIDILLSNIRETAGKAESCRNRQIQDNVSPVLQTSETSICDVESNISSEESDDDSKTTCSSSEVTKPKLSNFSNKQSTINKINLQRYGKGIVRKDISKLNLNLPDLSMLEDTDVNSSESSSSKTQENRNKRKWAEIPPPPSISYYTNDKRNLKKTSSNVDLKESISVGMNFLNSQKNERSKKKIKGLLDIM